MYSGLKGKMGVGGGSRQLSLFPHERASQLAEEARDAPSYTKGHFIWLTDPPEGAPYSAHKDSPV